MTEPEPSQPVVYRVYDKTGRLIYVGASQRLKKRLQTHGSQSWWYGLLGRVETEEYPTLEAAYAAEAAAIRTEAPAFNVTHSGRHWLRRRLADEDLLVCRQWVRAKRDGGCVGLLPTSMRWIADSVDSAA